MPADFEDRLSDLKNTLENMELDIEKKRKETTVYKSGIANLEKMANEIKQVSGAYAQTYQKIRTDTDDIESYFNNKLPMILAAVKDDKDAIDAEIEKNDKQIADISDELSDVETKHSDALAAYNSAKATRDASLSNYNTYKSAQKEIEKEIEKNIKKLKELKAAIEKEEDANEASNMYFYVLELQTLLNKTKGNITPKGTFDNKLSAAFESLDNAEESLRTAESELDAAIRERAGKQKELDEAMKNRDKNILEALKSL